MQMATEACTSLISVMMNMHVLHLYLPAQFSEADIQFMLFAGGLLITAVVICHSQRRETLTRARLQYNILHI